MLAIDNILIEYCVNNPAYATPIFCRKTVGYSYTIILVRSQGLGGNLVIIIGLDSKL